MKIIHQNNGYEFIFSQWRLNDRLLYPQTIYPRIQGLMYFESVLKCFSIEGR